MLIRIFMNVKGHIYGNEYFRIFPHITHMHFAHVYSIRFSADQ